MHGHGMGAVGYCVATYIYKKKKDDSNVATNMNHGVVSFLSWFKSICNFGTSIMRFGGQVDYTKYDI